MATEEKIKRKRRQKHTMEKVRQNLVKLILDSIGSDTDVTFSDIKTIYNQFGLSHLSDASIRRDLELAGIRYNGFCYVLDGMKDPQQTSLELSKLIHHFDIFNPLGSINGKKGSFEDLSLAHFYLRLKPDIDPEIILQFKALLQDYLNQVHNLFISDPKTYPLERYFFDITESNQTLVFLINKKQTFRTFYRLLITIKECDLNRSHKHIKLFYIKPE